MVKSGMVGLAVAIPSTEVQMSWMHTRNLYAWIFNTGRGLAICLRLPNNRGILYDLGRSDDFSPCDFVRKHIAPHLKGDGQWKISQCVMSHPHADHITEVDEILPAAGRFMRPLNPSFITCPNDKSQAEGLDFGRIQREDNIELIKKYRLSYQGRQWPLQTITRGEYEPETAGFEYGLYYMRPPMVNVIHDASDQHYGNGVSLVLYVRYGDMSMLLPGDITPEIMRDVLDDGDMIEKRYSLFYDGNQAREHGWHRTRSSQPGLRNLLAQRGLSVLVAPHHGLESCHSVELFDAIRGGKPLINVISEKPKKADTDGDVHQRYQGEDGAVGLNVDIEREIQFRYSVSTKNGHHILVVMREAQSTPGIYLRKKPEDLLNIE